MNCCTRAHVHVFCVTELHNFNDVYSVSFVQHIEAQMSDLLLFFQRFRSWLWEYLIIDAHTELMEQSILWSEYVWYSSLGFFIFNHKHQEAVFHVLLSYLLSSFPALLLFPQIAWVISPPNSLPLACSKGSFIHTVPLIFHSIKTLPVLWFFKQAWVSKVLEKKKQKTKNTT